MKQAFRSTAVQVLGWIWMAFAAFNAVDLIVRFSGRPSMIAAAVLTVLTAVVLITCLRPVTKFVEDGVLVRNPLRNFFVPWPLVDDVSVSHSIMITSGGRKIRCWTPQASGRERVSAMRRALPSKAGRLRTEPARSKGEQAAVEALAGKTHADWVAEQLLERARSAKRTASKATGTVPEPGTVRVTWSPTALAALAVSVAMIVAALLS
ncbi:hypothetical protein [Streptosporangium jomthongense]|uniref:PH domain-containing protein n=1 Tax=Streptosporangium jomthongense TaxID=1193683 RepID=A0ABV8F620_9ACTN